MGYEALSRMHIVLDPTNVINLRHHFPTFFSS